MNYLNTSADVSSCERYRYSLTRRWSDGPQVAFVGLNPSTADASLDDPTIRRCVRFAQDWDFGALVMVNLYAWRATQPNELRGAQHPEGVRNNAALRRAFTRSQQVILAWGVHGARDGRAGAFLDLWTPTFGEKFYHLGLTKAGHPKHPLYLRADTVPAPWLGKEAA